MRTYAGIMMVIWLSMLSASIHSVHGFKLETIVFAVLQIACVACGILEVGFVESGRKSRAIFPARIMVTISAAIYALVNFIHFFERAF